MAIKLKILETPAVRMHVGAQIVVRNPDTYIGPYEITPADEAQTIPISGKTALQDISINPIPSNYAHVTWDGTKLRFS